MEDQLTLWQRFKNWRPIAAVAESIRRKLLLSLLLLAIVPLVIAGGVSYAVGSQALEDQAFEELEALRSAKQEEINSWLESRRNDVQTLSENPAVAELTGEFLTNIIALGDGNHQVGNSRVRQFYLDKPQITDALDGSAYSQIHSRWHPVFTEYVGEYGYNDLHIVDKDGDIVYTTKKEDDFGTNLVSGPYADSGLGRAFRQTVSVNDRDFTMLEDFSVFELNGERQAFIASPILSGGISGETIGVLIYELPLQRLNQMLHGAQLGETGEAYLVGSDNLFRTDSRFLDELGVSTTILNDEFVVDTTAVRSAFSGDSGTQIIDDYRGSSVLSSWAPIVAQPPTATDPDGVTWAIMAEIDEAEVDAPANQLALIIGGLIVGSLVVVVVSSYLLANGLTNQVDEISTLFSQIGMGDFDARADVVSQDELGVMAISLNSMLDNTLTLIESREERDEMQNSIMKLLQEVSGVADGDLTTEAEVTADMTGAIADSFNYMIEQLRDIISNVQEATLQVSSSATEVQATAEHLAQGSEAQADQILDTTAAIDEMSVSIRQVSENAALSASVGEQARNNAKTGRVAVENTIDGMNRIREQVQETAKRIKRLGESSQEIGDIVHLIGDIADRTSILALNASIQAAMAGDAGRGFAVVAEEVERLAERSTEATKQIDNLIRTIQNETYEAVASMEEMTNHVVEGSDVAYEAGQSLAEIEQVSERLSELIQSISMASKQQARGSETIARAMNDIADVTQQTAAGTKQAAVSINSLTDLADRLRGSVSTFRLPEKASPAGAPGAAD